MPGREEGALWRWQHSKAKTAAVSSEPVEFAEIAGWSEDDHCAALACYLRSAHHAAQPVPLPAEGSLPVLLEDRSRARSFFEENFVAQRVLAEPGLLTSYFEPVLNGSRKRSPQLSVPVYRRPADLKPLPPGHALCALGFTAVRDASGALEPYFTRAEIEAGALEGRGLEILFVAGAIEAFIMHVQGSGRIELDDGSALRLSFDGKNGYPYTSVSKVLIERGDLTVEAADLEGMTAWLRAQPNPQATLNENKSYAFFRELEPDETGPKGSMGAELWTGRSLAADPLYHTLGMPIWVSAPGLTFERQPFQRLVIAQDTGSAIRGPQRGDIFAGMGAEAGAVAGRIRHSCQFIMLQPR